VEKRGSVTQVEIFGQTYSVRAEGDSTYIQDLARFVDSRL
jgi:cell division protein ZapA (FtsZ GTPase activity inhibitor)